MTYRISVEPSIGPGYPFVADQTDLENAKRIARRAFRMGGCRTVAVLQVDGKHKQEIIDIYDGEWLSSTGWRRSS